MANSVKNLVRRHGAGAAAVTAAGVAAYLLVSGVAVDFVAFLVAASIYPDAGAFAPNLARAFLFAGSFTIGYFLSLWILAPIAAELRVGHVITRAVLATGVGATIVFIVFGVLALLESFTFVEAVFGYSFPQVGFEGNRAVVGLSSALSTAFAAFMAQLPLGVLAGVMLWLWRKDHAPKHPLSGLIDEV